MSRDALNQKPIDEPDLVWRVLVTLNAFRVLISLTLLALFFVGTDPLFFGDSDPVLFAATASGCLVFAALSGIALRQRWVPFTAHGVPPLLFGVVAN